MPAAPYACTRSYTTAASSLDYTKHSHSAAPDEVEGTWTVKRYDGRNAMSTQWVQCTTWGIHNTNHTLMYIQWKMYGRKCTVENVRHQILTSTCDMQNTRTQTSTWSPAIDVKPTRFLYGLQGWWWDLLVGMGIRRRHSRNCPREYCTIPR